MEQFVDQIENPIPPRQTWDLLSTTELVDVKLRLEANLWAFKKQPAIVKVLSESVQYITQLLDSKLNS